MYIGRKVDDLLKAMSHETHFILTDKQLKEYYDSYMKNIRLCVDEEGMLAVDIG